MATGDAYAEAERHEDALATFSAAWDAIPEPKDENEWAVNVLAAIADCRFFLGQWEQCRQAIQHAFRCGADVSNPFLRLRLGQSLYELGDLRESANGLSPFT
jgi:hypothetical protein